MSGGATELELEIVALSLLIVLAVLRIAQRLLSRFLRRDG